MRDLSIRGAAALFFSALLSPQVLSADVPEAIVSNGAIVLQVHAVGAQIYECKADAGGQRSW